jgi:acyl carrier protein
VDTAALRARTDTVPALLRGLAPQARRAAASAVATGVDAVAEMTERLAGLTPAAQHETLLDLVRGQIALVLGHGGGDEVEAIRPFRELGFDSLTAVELRNALVAQTGVRLPATLVFDYPTPSELVDHLRAQIAPATVSGPDAILADLDRLDKSFDELDLTGDAFDEIAGRLEVLKARWAELRANTRVANDKTDFDFDSASDEEVFDLLDKQLGLS